MRNRLVMMVLALIPASAAEAQFSRWGFNFGYSYATYPGVDQHYSGFGLGFQIPLGGIFRLNARAYQQNTSDDDFSSGAAIDLGIQMGVGNKVGELSFLAGISANGVADDYVSGGLSPHYGVMGRVWVYRFLGVYGEWIRRPLSGWSERQTGIGFGVTIRGWP